MAVQALAAQAAHSAHRLMRRVLQQPGLSHTASTRAVRVEHEGDHGRERRVRLRRDGRRGARLQRDAGLGREDRA